jgi:hypothetical protein
MERGMQPPPILIDVYETHLSEEQLERSGR